MGVAGDARASVVSRRHMEAGSWRLVLAGRLLPYALIGPALLVIIGVLGYPLGTLVWATPSIPAINLWQWMFDYEFGVINWLLTHLGAGNYIHHNWFENPIQGFAVITVIVVWGAIPFLALMLYAGLTQVPRELVEAAEIDGARPWQVFANVAVPILRPLLLVLFSLSTIWDFQAFNQVWVLLNQRPPKDYFLISVYCFQASFRGSQYGLGSAAAVVMVAILVVVTFFYVRQTVRLTTEAI